MSAPMTVTSTEMCIRAVSSSVRGLDELAGLADRQPALTGIVPADLPGVVDRVGLARSEGAANRSLHGEDSEPLHCGSKCVTREIGASEPHAVGEDVQEIAYSHRAAVESVSILDWLLLARRALVPDVDALPVSGRL